MPTAPSLRWAALLALLLLLQATACEPAGRPTWNPTPAPAAVGPAAPEAPWEPEVAAASDEAENAIQAFVLDERFEVRLVAAEPLLANPVGMAVDHLGRIWVAECHRRNAGGCADNRDHPYWVDDDIAAQTVEDRRAFVLKHHPEYAEEWTRGSEYVRMLQDDDGDGVMDRSTVFAEGFDDLLDGTGADVFFHEGQVWFACIPNMWRLADEDGDGVAEKREKLFEGFGVRYALRGHDLHGMVIGPDGRIYFSIGDRGYDVVTKEGDRLHDPSSGAVFRCEPDGTGLEVFAYGLRNPQDLAFDDLGNLVTGDNNSDDEDKARIVYVVEGGITGWRMNFQSKPKRGPWVREGWWKTRHEDQAAFLIPPVAHLGSGPSGILATPGTGLPERYDGWFLLCDFLGSRSHSGLRAFKLEPEGAGMKLAEEHWFLKGLLATDLVFTADGEIQLCDWVSGWNGPGKGRIYAIRDPEAREEEAAVEARALLRRGHLRDLETPRLAELLGHRDRRVRQLAQFALVERRDEGRETLAAAAAGRGPAGRLARLHGIWGLGQIGRRDPAAAPFLLDLLGDADGEVRAQTARVLAEIDAPTIAPRLVPLLSDPAPRARFFAALAVGRKSHRPALAAVLRLAEENDDEDLYLRHAAVMALAGIADADALAADAVAGHPSRAVRLAALLALRRLQDPRVSRFLDDPLPFLRVEAARAVHDVPIVAGYEALAARLGDPSCAAEPFVRRAISARDLLSRPADAEALARFAAATENAPAMRIEALQALADWATNPPNDRVLKDHRPRPAREAGTLSAVARPIAPALLDDEEPGVRLATARLVGRAGLFETAPRLLDWVRDADRPVPHRIAALESLEQLATPQFRTAVDAAIRSGEPRLRGTAAALLVETDPRTALAVLVAGLERGEPVEMQLCFDTLARLANADADRILEIWVDRLLETRVPAAARLELVEAVETRAEAGSAPLAAALERWRRSRDATDHLADWLLCLEGGDAARGRTIFDGGRADCRRCHALDFTDKPMAGPGLADAGARRGRRFLLESIVMPNRSVHEDYRQISVETRAGAVHLGRLIEEGPDGIVLEINRNDVEFERLVIAAADVASRRPARSAMPEDTVTKLDRREIRDLVELLAHCKKTRDAESGEEDEGR